MISTVSTSCSVQTSGIHRTRACRGQHIGGGKAAWKLWLRWAWSEAVLDPDTNCNGLSCITTTTVLHYRKPKSKLCWLSCNAAVQVQREYLDTQIRGLSNSHIIHPGIKRQKVPLVPAHGRIKDIALPVKVGGCCLLLCGCPGPMLKVLAVHLYALSEVLLVPAHSFNEDTGQAAQPACCLASLVLTCCLFCWHAAASVFPCMKPEDIPGVKEAGWSAGNAFKAG